MTDGGRRGREEAWSVASLHRLTSRGGLPHPRHERASWLRRPPPVVVCVEVGWGSGSVKQEYHRVMMVLLLLVEEPVQRASKVNFDQPGNLPGRRVLT